jgi:2,3-dihydroxybenzoate-AMP ligase
VEWFDADLQQPQGRQVGGAKFEPAAAVRVRGTLGCDAQQVFGMAEGLLNYTRPGDPDEVVFHTQGRPLSPADEILVVDEDDRPVPPGAVGQLLTRGPYTIRGYYRAEEHNATAFTRDGFYRTGDLVHVTAGGDLVVAGRVKDVINRGGDKVPAEELESLLAAHPLVRRVAVVPVPDDVLGERTCAVLVPNGEAPTLSSLVEFLQERGVAAYKLPDRLEVVGELPLTAVGKIDKKELARTVGAPTGR